jgi:hypothetical protein
LRVTPACTEKPPYSPRLERRWDVPAVPTCGGGTPVGLGLNPAEGHEFERRPGDGEVLILGLSRRHRHGSASTRGEKDKRERDLNFSDGTLDLGSGRRAIGTIEMGHEQGRPRG